MQEIISFLKIRRVFLPFFLTYFLSGENRLIVFTISGNVTTQKIQFFLIKYNVDGNVVV